jgi:hypothetical protein
MLSKLKMGTLIDLSKKDIPWISDIAKSLVLKDKRFAHHVESWKDELKNQGNVRVGKTDSQGNWHSVSTSDKKEIEKLKSQGYKVVKESVDIKALAKQFRKNEDENRHSENYLMLAKAFGTSREVREVEAIIRRNKIQGHTDPKDNKWMFDNIGKYFHKIRQGESVEEMFSTRSLGLKGASKRSREKARAKEKEQKKSKKKEEVEENLNEKKAEYLSLSVAGLGDAKRVERWLYKNYSHVNTPYDGPYISDLNVEFENVDDADKLMADLKRAGLKFTVDVRESLIVGLNKSSAEYKAGKDAAKKGIKYDANPHAPGVKRLNWSTGHNDFRADALRKAGKPNYGARGQFEEVQEADLTKTQIKMVHDKADELPKNDFIKRYGKDGDAVRFATATNIVKKKLGIEEETSPEVADVLKKFVTANPLRFHGGPGLQGGKNKRDFIELQKLALSNMDKFRKKYNDMKAKRNEDNYNQKAVRDALEKAGLSKHLTDEHKIEGDEIMNEKNYLPPVKRPVAKRPKGGLFNGDDIPEGGPGSGPQFSSATIKKAYGILNDPRYKQGNYSGAAKAIEKLGKGLSNHPDVKNAMKRANESIEEKSTEDKLKKWGPVKQLPPIKLPLKFGKPEKVGVKSSYGEDHDCEHEHPGVSHESWKSKEKKESRKYFDTKPGSIQDTVIKMYEDNDEI